MGIGLLFLFMALWIMTDPTLEITVNGVKRHALWTDGLLPLSFGGLALIFYGIVGRRVVAMRMGPQKLQMDYKGKFITKTWAEVETIKKYWLVAPPLYSVTFKNDPKPFYFTTRNWFIATPIGVYDLSAMGKFIRDQKKKIEHTRS
ncbi:MAG: hypothetical protein KQI35_07485 [Bacteroidetes bacterium]|nr:hypothetical protein [Bacteroidota bacterium]